MEAPAPTPEERPRTTGRRWRAVVIVAGIVVVVGIGIGLTEPGERQRIMNQMITEYGPPTILDKQDARRFAYDKYGCEATRVRRYWNGRWYVWVASCARRSDKFTLDSYTFDDWGHEQGLEGPYGIGPSP